MTFLKKQTVDVDGQSVEITQLSGLDRFDFMEYCAEMPQPAKVEPLGENPSEAEREQYSIALSKSYRHWGRLSFVGHCRLIAYGYPGDTGDIDQRHQEIMKMMSPEQAKALHDEIARFSGMPLPDDSDSPPSDEAGEETPSEPIDPKA